MTKQVETMASTSAVPWAGLGNKVSEKQSPKQMMNSAGLNWTVSKRELFLDGKTKIPGRYALCRDTDDAFLSIVGNTYKPVQNEDAMSFFKQFTDAGNMAMEHAGSLANGQYIWALASINEDFVLGKDDEVKSYLLLCQPHVRGRSMVIQYTTVRTWCWNTLGRILKGNASARTQNGAFRMPHSMKFDEATQETAKMALGLASEQQKEFKEAAELLSKKRAKASEVDDFFMEILQYDPKEAKTKKNGDPKEPRALSQFRAALEHAPGQQLKTTVGTWWGALNAVTYVVDHERGRKRDTALKSAWLGAGARLKQSALSLALEKAS